MTSQEVRVAIDVVAQFTSALKVGDVAAAHSLVREDLVFSEAPSLPFGGDRLGKQGLVDLLTAISRDYRIRLDDPLISEAGDRVLVRVSGTISSRATGRELPLEALDLYALDDQGLIARVDVFYKDAAAVTALLDDVSGAA